MIQVSDYKATSMRTRLLIETYEALRRELKTQRQRAREAMVDGVDEEALGDLEREYIELEDSAAGEIRSQRAAERAVREVHGAELCAVMGDVVVESYASIARSGDLSELPDGSDKLRDLPSRDELRELNVSEPSWQTLLVEQALEVGDTTHNEHMLEAKLIEVASLASRWVAVLRQRRRAES